MPKAVMVLPQWPTMHSFRLFDSYLRRDPTNKFPPGYSDKTDIVCYNVGLDNKSICAELVKLQCRPTP